MILNIIELNFIYKLKFDLKIEIINLNMAANDKLG